MRSLVLVRVAWQSILKNTMRTLLTMLGIIIGVGAVIVMVAVGLGAKERINQQIQNLGTNMIVLTAGSSKQGGVSQGAQSFNRLSVENAEALRREGTLLTAISPVIFTGGHIQGGAGNWRTTINGVSLDYQFIRDWQVTSGSFFDATDVRVARKAAVIGATVAANLYPEQDPVGLHEQYWHTRLVCPGGGQYVWNEQWQTMESTVYGCPAAPKEGPVAAPELQAIKYGNFGVTFEDQGLHARVSLER